LEVRQLDDLALRGRKAGEGTLQSLQLFALQGNLVTMLRARLVAR
jgi:hypothetical protein